MIDPKVLWSPAGYLVFPDVPAGKTDGLDGTDAEDLCLCVSTRVATFWPHGFCKSRTPNLEEPNVLQCLDCLEVIKAMLVTYAKGSKDWIPRVQACLTILEEYMAVPNDRPI